MSDISALANEAALQGRSAALLRLQGTALRNAANAIVICQSNGEIAWVNPAFTTLTGYSLEEARGVTPRLLNSGRQPAGFYRHLWKTIVAGEIWRGEITNRRKDGSLFHVEQTIAPVCSASGEITHFIGIMNDVSNRRRAEEVLKQSERQFREVLESLALIAVMLDPEGRVTFCNDALLRLSEWSREEVLGEDWFTRFVPEPEPQARRAFLESIGSGSLPRSHETPIRTRRGELRYIAWNNTVLRDELRKITGTASIGEDITERRRSERRLGDAYNLLRTVLEASPVGILAYQDDGTFLFANEAAAGLTGGTIEALRGQNFRQIRSWQESELLSRAERVLQTGRGEELEVHITTSFGREAWLSWRFVPFRFENKLQLLALFSDIGERKSAELQRIRSEQLLRESEGRYRHLFENAHDLILIIAPDGRLRYANRACETALGYSAEELSELRFSNLVHDRSAAGSEWFAQAASGKPVPFAESEFLAKSGKPICVQGSVTAQMIEGEVVSIYCIFRDVTEKRDLEKQVLRAQRLESIGTLAGGIAHDLNNALAPIMLSLELLRERFNDPESVSTIDLLARSTKRAGTMVKQVLAFSRGVEGKRTQLQLSHLIREMVTILRQTLPKTIEIKTRIAEDLWTVTGDSTQLHQVLLNLCVNARDAMPNGGSMLVSASNFQVDEPFASTNVEAQIGRHILLVVRDNGTGMTPEIRERIFDPFFTTKPLDKGTGLGLSTVRGIVKSHQGFLTVASEPGKGSEFRVYLPATDAPAEGAEEASASVGDAEVPRAQGELILMVDDDENVRAMTQKALESAGYGVITAEDGAQAVGLYARNREKVRLVLTDLAMPLMDGLATIRALRSITPDLKVILCSGLPPDGRADVDKLVAPNAFLHKPFSANALIVSVAKLISEKL